MKTEMASRIINIWQKIKLMHFIFQMYMELKLSTFTTQDTVIFQEILKSISMINKMHQKILTALFQEIGIDLEIIEID